MHKVDYGERRDYLSKKKMRWSETESGGRARWGMEMMTGWGLWLEVNGVDRKEAHFMVHEF
jgi:hypothetical protein